MHAGSPAWLPESLDGTEPLLMNFVSPVLFLRNTFLVLMVTLTCHSGFLSCAWFLIEHAYLRMCGKCATKK